MKIKNKTQQKLLFIALMVLISVIVYQIRNPIVINKECAGTCRSSSSKFQFKYQLKESLETHQSRSINPDMSNKWVFL